MGNCLLQHLNNFAAYFEALLLFKAIKKNMQTFDFDAQFQFPTTDILISSTDLLSL